MEHVFELGSLDHGLSLREPEVIEEVLHRVHTGSVQEPGSLVGLVFHGRDDQGCGVEDGAERGDPRGVVVRRTEQREEGIGHMRLQHVGDPPLPLREQLGERRRHPRVPHPVEELRARRRGTCTRVEQQDADLPPVEGLVQHGQVRDHHREQAEAGCRLDDGDRCPTPG